MAEIIIKKKVTLEFLGEDYEDSYLVFRSISIQEFPALMKKVEAASDDNVKSLSAMIDMLQDHFVEGIFDKQKVSQDDLGKFDAETIIKCFELLTGQADPKDNSESTTTSTTEADTAQK